MPSAAIMAQLETYRRYERGWDSYGAEPFAPGHLDHAARIALLLADYADLMHVAPSRGGIQIGLQRAGRFAELDVLPDGTVEALCGTENPLTFREDDGSEEDRPRTDEELLHIAAWVRHGDGDGDGQEESREQREGGRDGDGDGYGTGPADTGRVAGP